MHKFQTKQKYCWSYVVKTKQNIRTFVFETKKKLPTLREMCRGFGCSNQSSVLITFFLCFRRHLEKLK